MRSFAHRPFWFADLEQGSACRVFLEQDECVLAIFRECGTNANTRQWEGSIDDQDNVVLSPITQPSTRPQPSRCRGPLLDADSGEPWARLTCEGAVEHLGLLLETVLEDPTPFAPVDTAERVTIELGSSPVLPTLVDVDELSPAGERELWVSVSPPQTPQDTRIHIMALDAQARVESIPLPGLKNIDNVGDVVFAVGEKQVHRIDAVTRTIVTSTTVLPPDVTDELLTVVARRDGEALFTFSAPALLSPQRSIRRISADLDQISDPTIIPALIIRGFAGSSTSSTSEALYLVGQTGVGRGQGVLYALNDGLETLWSMVLPFGPSDAILLEDGPRVAMIAANAKVYWEVDLQTRSVTSLAAVPFAGRLAALSHDQANDRIFIAGGDGKIVPFDRASGRAQQDLVKTEFSTGALFFDAVTQKLYAFATTAGIADILRVSR